MLPSHVSHVVVNDDSAETYLRLTAVSSSRLIATKRSPAHGLVSDEPTNAMRQGTALHDLVLLPSVFAEKYAVWDKVGPRNRNPLKAEWEAFKAANATKEIVDDAAALYGMRDAVMAQPYAKKLLEGGLHEKSIYWQWKDTICPCKARPDIIHPKGILADLKQMENAGPDDASRALWTRGYYIQLAWYRIAINLAIEAGALPGVEPIQHAVLICVEPDPPYAAAVYEIDNEALLLGDAEAKLQYARIEECAARNEWPAYPTTPQVISLPKWANK